MIKINFAKFILLFTLALVSVSACYPNDFECSDNSEILSSFKKDVVSHQDSSAKQSQSSSSDSDNHYCVCSLSCHTMFINFSTSGPLMAYVLSFPKEFQYIAQNYPEVSYSLEKPPAI